jgi:hypothetical protein
MDISMVKCHGWMDAKNTTGKRVWIVQFLWRTVPLRIPDFIKVVVRKERRKNHPTGRANGENKKELGC